MILEAMTSSKYPPPRYITVHSIAHNKPLSLLDINCRQYSAKRLAPPPTIQAKPQQGPDYES